MVESPSHLREHPQPTKLALLCALLVLREREVTDTLAQLLISTIHRINAHAEQKVVEEFVKDFRRVRGKDTMLRRIAEASLVKCHELFSADVSVSSVRCRELFSSALG